jgi:hypothetical protein
LDTCASLGQRLLRPDTVREIKDSGQLDSLVTVETWVALTDALHERGTSKTGWQVVPGDEIFADTGLWGSSDPDTPNDDCVRHIPGIGLSDRDCDFSFAFRCEFPAAASTQSDSRQHTVSIFASTSVPGFTQDSAGCNQAISECPTPLLCAVNCGKRTGCVGFYHNRMRRQCVLLMHFDATVQLEWQDESEKRAWTKMLMRH